MMIQVSENTFVNANEVALVRFTPRKTMQLVLNNGTEVETHSTTEEKTEKLFRQLVIDIDQLQRQAVR